MSEISNYLLAVLGVVIILVVIDLIMPDGKTSKYIKSIASIFIVAVIISPAVNLVKSDFDWKTIFTSSQYQVDEVVLDKINQQKIKILESELTEFLNKEGFKGVEVMISTKVEKSDLKINYIYVNLCDLVINENLAHIDYYTKIKELIKEQVDIEEDKIVLYG